MERIRTIEVTLVIDTNKRTITEAYAPSEDETIAEFAQRVAAEIVEIVEGVA